MSRDDLARVRRRQLGFVFQDYNLVPTLTAVENVSVPLELDGVSATRARKAAEIALERVGVPELVDRHIEKMSGGQRQRVAIARGIVGDRRVLLADEPTGALDSVTGDEIMALIRTLADEGVAVVLVTHEARHAAWADRVIFLRDGRLVDESQVVSDPMELLNDNPKRGRW
jgi:putative ABC transport system ATP-binding protein